MANALRTRATSDSEQDTARLYQRQYILNGNDAELAVKRLMTLGYSLTRARAVVNAWAENMGLDIPFSNVFLKGGRA